MKVVITIPAYNEEKSIVNVIKEIKKAMPVRHRYKILVVNDGSTDNTAQVAKKAGALVYSHPYNLGLAKTFRTEMKKCLSLGARAIVHIDADGQYRASEIPKLLKEIESGSDLVLGSRFAGTIEKMSRIKRWGNKAFSRTISRIIKQKISDTQTGFRAFTAEIAKLPIISNHTYTQEQVLRAINTGFKVKEVPVYFAKRKEGKSKLITNPFEYAFKAWTNIFRIYRDFAPLKFFGTIGGILFITGLLIGIYFLGMHLTSGIRGHLGLLFLMIALLFTGLQIILFGFLADMMRNRR